MNKNLNKRIHPIIKIDGFSPIISHKLKFEKKGYED